MSKFKLPKKMSDHGRAYEKWAVQFVGSMIAVFKEEGVQPESTLSFVTNEARLQWGDHVEVIDLLKVYNFAKSLGKSSEAAGAALGQFTAQKLMAQFYDVNPQFS